MAAPMRSIYSSAAILLVFARSCNSDGLLPTNYGIDTLCDDVLKMEKENITAGTLKSSETSTDELDSDCWITIIAPPEHHIVIHVIKVDMGSHSKYYCPEYVRISDGSENRNALTLHLCDASNKTVKSSGQNISVNIHRENTTREKDINILFTSFHTGICEPEEFKCDNGYCIDNRLKCNGYNNCGDGSDLCQDIVLPIVITLCGLTLFFGFIVFMIRLLIRQHNRVQFHKGGYVIKTASKETIPMTAPPPQQHVQPTAPNIPWADQSPESMPTQNPANIQFQNPISIPVPHPPSIAAPKYEHSLLRHFPSSAKN